MKTNLLGFLSLTIGLVVLTGCGLNPLADTKQEGEPAATASPMALGSTKVKECDELIGMIEQSLQNPEEGYFERAARELVLNTAKEQVLKLIEQETDLTKLASTCGEIKKGLDGQLTSGQN